MPCLHMGEEGYRRISHPRLLFPLPSDAAMYMLLGQMENCKQTENWCGGLEGRKQFTRY